MTRAATLLLCLILGACSALRPGPTFAPTAQHPNPQVTTALKLYAEGNNDAALAAFNTLLADEDLNSEDRRRVLAGAALVHLQRGGATNLENARQQVEAFTALNTGPISPDFFLLRESLDIAITTALAEHKKQGNTRRENARLRREIQRLEATLTKLRELTLE